MPPPIRQLFVPVEPYEWDQAEIIKTEVMKANPGVTNFKISRKDEATVIPGQINHSFECVDGALYALDRETLSTGGFGKVKLAINQQKELFVAKITAENRSTPSQDVAKTIQKKNREEANKRLGIPNVEYVRPATSEAKRLFTKAPEGRALSQKQILVTTHQKAVHLIPYAGQDLFDFISPYLNEAKKYAYGTAKGKAILATIEDCNDRGSTNESKLAANNKKLAKHQATLVELDSFLKDPRKMLNPVRKVALEEEKAIVTGKITKLESEQANLKSEQEDLLTQTNLLENELKDLICDYIESSPDLQNLFNVIALQASLDLQKFHDLHLIHRDLKLENMTIKFDLTEPFNSSIKIIDLDSVTPKEPGNPRAFDKFTFGTSRYMSSEAATEYSRQVDIYALGKALENELLFRNYEFLNSETRTNRTDPTMRPFLPEIISEIWEKIPDSIKHAEYFQPTREKVLTELRRPEYVAGTLLRGIDQVLRTADNIKHPKFATAARWQESLHSKEDQELISQLKDLRKKIETNPKMTGDEVIADYRNIMKDVLTDPHHKPTPFLHTLAEGLTRAKVPTEETITALKQSFAVVEALTLEKMKHYSPEATPEPPKMKAH